MTIIQWLSETIGEGEGEVQAVRRPSLRRCMMSSGIDWRTRKVFFVALFACAHDRSGLPLTAWTADLPALSRR